MYFSNFYNRNNKGENQRLVSFFAGKPPLIDQLYGYKTQEDDVSFFVGLPWSEKCEQN